MSLLSIAGATPSDEGFELKSLRINDDDSAYLQKVYPTSGNRLTWTFSCWSKVTEIGVGPQTLFCGVGESGGRAGWFEWQTTNEIAFYEYNWSSYQANVKTTAKYRDPAAWYHAMVVYDSTQATAANRVKIYINGEHITVLSSTTYPAQNYAGSIGYGNGVRKHTIGRNDATADQADCYIAEAYYIDGQALLPSSFGETNEDTNQWQPKNPTDIKPTVTFGTNGFYMPFSNDVLADSFEDSALHQPHTFTVYGNAVTSTDQKKFGTASYFGEGDGDYIKAPSSDDWNFRTGDFTIEFWARFDTLAADMEFLTHVPPSWPYTNGWILWWNNPTDGITFNSLTQGSHSGWAIDTWYHIAVVRAGTTTTIYRDGVSIVSGTDSWDQDFDGDWPLYIGELQTPPGEGFEGYLDEIRISKGIARYVGEFTPPTEPFTSDQYTKLLLHCDGADDGTTFTDSADSAPRHTITAVGDVKNTRISNYPVGVNGDTHIIGPKVGTSALSFAEVGDLTYLSLADSADWNFGSGDCTLECWINHNSWSSSLKNYLDNLIITTIKCLFIYTRIHFTGK